MGENRDTQFWEKPSDTGNRREAILGRVKEELKTLPAEEQDDYGFLYDSDLGEDESSSKSSEDGTPASSEASGQETTSVAADPASEPPASSAISSELQEMRALAEQVRNREAALAEREKKVSEFYEREYYKTNQPAQEQQPATEMQKYLQAIPDDLKPLFQPIAEHAERAAAQAQQAYQASAEIHRNTAVGHLKGRFDAQIATMANAKDADGNPVYPDFDKHIPRELVEGTLRGMTKMCADGHLKDLNQINPQQLLHDQYWKTAGPSFAKQLQDAKKTSAAENKQHQQLHKVGNVPQSSGFQPPADKKFDPFDPNSRVGQQGFRARVRDRVKELTGI